MPATAPKFAEATKPSGKAKQPLSWKRYVPRLLVGFVITLVVFLIDDFVHSLLSRTKTPWVCFRAELIVAVACMILPFFILHLRGEKAKVSEPKALRTASKDATAPVPPNSSSPEGATKTRTSTAAVTKWNQAISAAAKDGRRAEAERLLRQLERQAEAGDGLDPDVISYNSIVHACAREGDIPSAEQWFARMKVKGVEPNVITYNILMDACAKRDDPEGAEAWLESMIQNGVDPNEVSYATVIHARAKGGELKAAEAWLQRMLEAGVHPNVVSYNSLVYAYGRQGDVEGAERWVTEMQRQGLEARVTTYTALVDACAKIGRVDRAEKWMDTMLSSTDKELQPNVVSFSSMIDACAKAGDSVRAQRWLHRMLEHGVQPNAHTFSAVINACAKAGDVPAALRSLGRMDQAGVPADVVAYSGVLDACAKVGDSARALQVFRQMRSRGIQPNLVTYSSLGRPFAHQGEWCEVERIRCEMAADGLVMNEYFLYTILLAYANAKPKEVHRAEHVFQEAVALGIKVNKHIITVLGRAVGRPRAAKLLQALDEPAGQGTAVADGQ